MRAPEDTEIPDSAEGELIHLGQQIATQTARYASAYAGNALNCTSCHLDGGRMAGAIPWVGIWAAFPQYQARSGRVILLSDRINDCFQRSLNGRSLPLDSREMLALQSYMRWLSLGVPVGSRVAGRGLHRLPPPVAKPSPARGQQAYAEHCAACHGDHGEGAQAGQVIAVSVPPLWGPDSFNLGAGMARLNSAAAFIKANMPLGKGGTLDDQTAYDIAAWFTRQPRPDFAAKAGDWPNGGKPVDAPY